MKHLLSTLFLTPLWADIVIESMKHDVVLITDKTFDRNIGKFRDNTVAAVLYFRPDNDAAILEEFNKVATQLKGMAKIAAINCETAVKFCAHEGKDAPTPFITVYPVNPMPSFLHKVDNIAKLSSVVSKNIPNNTKVLTEKDHDDWITTDASKPKVILFSEKNKVPTILRALSSESVFRRSINFGLVPKTEEALVSKYKITKFPTILQIRGTKAEIKEQYKGEMNFSDIHAWVNLYSESGMGDKVHSAGAGSEQSAEEKRPWLVQEIPELTGKSHQDICFKGGGDGLCVIFATDKPITDEEVSMLKLIKQKQNSNSQMADRGTKFKWMWINLAVEKNYAELFELSETPGVVVFNPHKRLRFTKPDEGKADMNSINSLLDKIMGGDARFKVVKGQKLPTWVARAEEPKAEKKGKEEL